MSADNIIIADTVPFAEFQVLFDDLRRGLSVRANTILTKNQLTNVYSLTPWITKARNDFLMLPGCGVSTSQELMQSIDQLRQYYDQQIYLIAIARQNEKFGEQDDSINNIPISVLQRIYNGLLSTTSVRTKNAITENNLLEIKNFMPYIRGDASTFLKFKNVGKRTALEFLYIAESLRNICENATPPVDTQHIPFKDIIPYTVDDTNSILDFKNQNRHWPLFQILTIYFKQSKTKQETAFYEYCLGNKSELLPINQLTSRFGYPTTNHFTQVVKAMIKRPSTRLKKILEHEDWSHYPLIDFPYIYNRTGFPIGGEVLSQSQLQLLIFLGKKSYYIDKSDCSIHSFYNKSGQIQLLVDDKYSAFNLKNVLKEIDRLRFIKAANSIQIPIRSHFIEGDSYWDTPTILTDEDKNILSSMVEEIASTLVDIDNHQIVIRSNFINYKSILYNILSDACTVLHIDEIFMRLESYCSRNNIACKYTKPSQIRPCLTHDGRFVPIGKSSYWGLKEWKPVSSSIKDIAISLVRNSESPIQIEKLSKLVLSYRSDSNGKSVSSIIRQCTANKELILFLDDYIGYPLKKYDKQYIPFPQNFEEYLISFQAFIINHKHFPFLGSSGLEGYLSRWYYRVKQFINLSADETIKINKLEEDYAMYPHNATENNFLYKCNTYQKFVCSNKRMIEKEDNQKLFIWYNKYISLYSSLNDNRSLYFSQLLKAISEMLH